MNATKNCYTKKHLHRFITNKKKISHNISNIKMQNFTKFIKQMANTLKPSSLIKIKSLNFSYQMSAYVECIQPAYQVNELSRTYNSLYVTILGFSLRKLITQDFRKSIFGILFLQWKFKMCLVINSLHHPILMTSEKLHYFIFPHKQERKGRPENSVLILAK